MGMKEAPMGRSLQPPGPCLWVGSPNGAFLTRSILRLGGHLLPLAWGSDADLSCPRVLKAAEVLLAILLAHWWNSGFGPRPPGADSLPAGNWARQTDVVVTSNSDVSPTSFDLPCCVCC